MYQLTKDIKIKGWKMIDIAKRWGKTPTRMSQIARDPEQMHKDAVDGLPNRKATSTRGTMETPK